MTTDALTITIYPIGYTTDPQTVDLHVYFGRMIDALEAKGFRNDPISGVEEDDDQVIYSFYHAVTGQNIDVTRWDVTPDGFQPVNALPLEILA